MDARSPRSDQLTLTQRNVYIVPSRGGWVYAAVTLVLLLAAINEQLNLAYALAFLLGGVGLSAMSTTHANLRGLSLTLGHANRAHAGQPVAVTVKLEARSGRRGRYGQVLDQSVPCEVPPDIASEVILSVPTQTRGWQELPRWRIHSTYPLGLFRAWSYWRAASPVLVWPALEASAPEPPVASALPSERPGQTPMQRSTEAHDLRPWRRGDALKDVAWRKSATRLASGQGPVSREAAHQSRPATHWIDWDDTAGLHTEARLSRLAAWLMAAEREAQRTGVPYGLRMPGLLRDGQQGLAHLHRCLDDLALWGQAP
jgi:uncharacterized protein (DUF58 family)